MSQPGTTPPPRQRHLVLVGGGHTHVQVLRSFAMQPPPHTHVTVVLDRPIAVYSGMVPGFIAGQYQAWELEIDVVPLARRAGASVVLEPAIGVDPVARTIELDHRPPIHYDLASFDIGSTVAGLDLPGAREHTIASRPIAALVQRIDELVDRARAGTEPFRTFVVGGGAGGVELAFALDQRLRATTTRPLEITVVHDKARILDGYSASLSRRVERQAERRGIDIDIERRVAEVKADHILFTDGEKRPADAVLWVTGAQAHGILANSGLDCDQRGFVFVRDSLQVTGHDTLFAVGDCATLRSAPRTPKAGVYAVRQGPFLIDNLRAALTERPLKSYRPQSDFLTLLNLGDGTAIGAKRGRSFEGRWVMNLKDWIDRRFMRRFQVLSPEARLTAEFEQPAMSSETPMLCGGCAAKIGQSALARALERLDPAPEDASVTLGLGSADDVAAWRSPEGSEVVTTIDGFRAFTDDPYTVGAVAAVNATSDVFAKGIEPRYAQALVTVSDALSSAQAEETLYQVLSGARSVLDRLGVSLLGGHSTIGPELFVGFSIEGVRNDGPLLRANRIEEGDLFVLTKALGTGVLMHADMQGRLPGPWLQQVLETMLEDNRKAGEIARACARAATDVTGFGLIGHLTEMLHSTDLAAELWLDDVPALSGALELLEQGLRSTAHDENARARAMVSLEALDDASRLKAELLFDPQTSGGLLLAIAPGQEQDALEQLAHAGYLNATVIGRARSQQSTGRATRVHLIGSVTEAPAR